MTPTATYIAEENCLQELPQMETPERHPADIDFGSALYNYWWHRWEDYNTHLASLRKIPCDPSCKGLWADWQKVVEGKDYEVKMDCKYPVSCFVEETCNCVYTAFPLVPEGEDLWEEFLQSVFDATGLNIANYPAGLKLLKSKYSLTKR